MLNHLGERLKDKIRTSEKGKTVTVIDAKWKYNRFEQNL
jgi:hypothetical protein